MAPDATSFVGMLPNLRRYARLLTGQQQLGDVLVMSTLQWIASDRSGQAPRKCPRVYLYQVLSRLWRSPVGDHLAGLMPLIVEPGDADQRFGAMVTVARAAFLLVSVEGFSRREVGEILEVSESDVASLLAEAHIAVSRQLATDVLIIEDELLIAFELEDLMTRLGHSVTSVVRTHRLAVKHARSRPPKLILADVNLADGSSGIDAVNEILTEISVPVIFITAYPERLLTGMRPEPTFVITKPFRAEEIQAVVGQALFFDLKSRSGLSSEALASGLVEGRMSEQMYESA